MNLRGWPVLYLALLVGGAAQCCRADIFHLRNGGSVEGALSERTEENYLVRTMVGIVTLPVDTVTRVETKPTILEEYEQRRRNLTDTVEEHLALAQWCSDQDYKAGWRTHLREALRLDPNCRTAREALGFVQVGEKWVLKSRLDKGANEQISPEAVTPDEAESIDEKNSALVRAIQSQWYRQIRAIRDQKLDSVNPQRLQDGREKILAIDDPLAIRPLARVLGDGGAPARDVLVEVLARFSQDEATVHLAVLAIVDPEENIRRKALVELKRRNDQRVTLQFRKGLYSQNDELIRRAAIALGVLRDRSAIPDLIELLTAERTKLVEISTRAFFQNLVYVFAQRTDYVTSNSRTVGYFPVVEINSPGFNTVIVDRDFQLRQVTVYRTEVLEALRGITGQSFGFDAEDWRRWYQEQKP